jgi:VanZ family protein
MSASPVLLNPYRPALRTDVRAKWLYAFFGVVFVCCTSNSYFGGIHTGALLNAVWRAVLGSWHYEMRGEVNEIMRKVGHFFGYGMIGVIFRNAWYTTARTLMALARQWTAAFAISLGVASTFIVACLDEWHQHYCPGRVSSFRDVLVDTTGALLLNVFLWEWRAYKRRRALNPLAH